MTEYIVRSRQTGRTSELLDILCNSPEDEHYVIITPTMKEALALIRSVHERGRGDLANRVHTLDGWQKRYHLGYANRKVRVLLDNADEILWRAVKAPIASAVLTRPEEVEK